MTTIVGTTGEGAEARLDAGLADGPPKHPVASRPATGTSAANAHFTGIETPFPVERFRDAA
jgi:hypothetical protein